MKSALPDGVDEVTVWQMISAYLHGEVENLPSSDTKVLPHSETNHAGLGDAGAMAHGCAERQRRSQEAQACGVSQGFWYASTGGANQDWLNYQQLWKAQKDACSDLWEIIFHLLQLRG